MEEDRLLLVEKGGVPARREAGDAFDVDGLDDSPTQKVRDGGSDGIYPFHLSNIHERCCAAYVMRAVPLTIFAVNLVVSVLGALWYRTLLLVTAAFFNLWFWLWLVTYALSTIKAVRAAQCALDEAERKGGFGSNALMPVSASSDSAGQQLETSEAAANDVVHLIVLPNYNEDESILAATLEALSQAVGSKDFHVVLAMEEREGPEKTHKKAVKLQERFAPCFRDICSALHPLDLEELHLDGSACAEVPGKSSNLKWAVNVGRERLTLDGVNLGNTVLTVADADCLFHPSYFDKVGNEFRELRKGAASGPQYPWTIWQPPQLPLRNYLSCATPARVWGYIHTVYEFGGVGGLADNYLHLTFSTFSLPFDLVSEACPWDGDVIADDHHCFLKCFLYGIYQQASKHQKAVGGGGLDPPLVVRPVMLPVKSTSVVAESCWSGWKARFNQATRHCQGVAEFSYILLGVFRVLRTMPRNAYGWELACKLLRVILLPFNLNLLPICQTFPFTAVTLLWIWHRGDMPECPNSLWLQRYDLRFWTCLCAGAMNAGVQMVFMAATFIFANAYMIDTCWTRPGCKTLSSLWYSEHAAVPSTLGSKRLTALWYTAVDCLIILPAVMPVYGFIPNVMSYWNCLVRGNRFDFISAMKSANGGQSTPGASPKLSPHFSPLTLRAGNNRDVELPEVVIGRSEADDVRLRQSSKFGKTPKSLGSSELHEGIV